MVPRVAIRGHSFKGAGQYYLHDKEADTSERVAWTYTHNLPTNNAEKAMGWMAHTAMSAGHLKEKAGVARTGRKASSGPVYSFSLAWHPEQEPSQEEMKNSGMHILELLGLNDHEAVFVAHQETEHPHVHVICNLVNPRDGRMAVPSYDFLKMSKWAEEYEREHGKIYCEERVVNNEKRRNHSKEDRQYELVKHREEKLKRAKEIQELYSQSDSGKAFQAALNEAGYTLAKGDRRGFVLVDEQGNIHSLSRQLKGQRAKDIKGRLSDIVQENLPQAKTLAEERKHFYRDDYETKRQEQIVDAAIEEEKERGADEKENQKSRIQKNIVDNKEKNAPVYDDAHLNKLDKLRAWEQNADKQRFSLEQELNQFYKRGELVNELETLKAELSKRDNFRDKITGRFWEVKRHFEAKQKNLQDTDNRISEKRNALELKLNKNRPDDLAYDNSNKPNPISRVTKEEQQIKNQTKDYLSRLDKIRAWEQIADRRRVELQLKMEKFYKREEFAERLNQLREEIKKIKNTSGLRSRKLQRLQEDEARYQLNLENIDGRIAEQMGKLEIDLAKTKPKGLSRTNERTVSQDLDISRQSENENLPGEQEKHDHGFDLDR